MRTDSQSRTRPESAARDLRTKSPLRPVVSRPLKHQVSPSRAQFGPLHLHFHPSTFPTRPPDATIAFLGSLTYCCASPTPPLFPFFQSPFGTKYPLSPPSIDRIPRSSDHPTIELPIAKAFPQVSFFIPTSPPRSPRRALAIPIATPPSSLPGATWLRSKVEPWTFSPDPPRCQSHCAPTACLIHI